MIKKIISVMLSFSLIFICALSVSADDISVSAKACVLMDADTGEILYEKNSSKKLSMASTTKIMTALLCLENKERDSLFKIKREHILVEGSSMGLLEDDEVNLKILAAGMLMLSGNDAANAAAIKISGSIESFCELMNNRAKEMGLLNTSFKTPSGLDDDEHYSTALDMARLGAEAIKNPDFLEICSKSKYTVKYNGKSRTLYNHNRLLKETQGCIGIKTGFTKKSGRCLVSAVKRNGRTLICVTLNAPNDWSDHKRLYSFGFDLFENYKLDTSFEHIKLNVLTGSDVSLSVCAVGDGEIGLKKGEEIKREIYVKPFYFAPVLKGEMAGEAVYIINDKEVLRLPLIFNETAL